MQFLTLNDCKAFIFDQWYLLGNRLKIRGKSNIICCLCFREFKILTTEKPASLRTLGCLLKVEQDQWQMLMNNNLSRNCQTVEFLYKNINFFLNKKLFSEWKALHFIWISFYQKDLCYHEFWAAASVIVMWKSSFSIETHVFSREVANWSRNILLLCLPNKCNFYDCKKHLTMNTW